MLGWPVLAKSLPPNLERLKEARDSNSPISSELMEIMTPALNQFPGAELHDELDHLTLAHRRDQLAVSRSNANFFCLSCIIDNVKREDCSGNDSTGNHEIVFDSQVGASVIQDMGIRVVPKGGVGIKVDPDGANVDKNWVPDQLENESGNDLYLGKDLILENSKIKVEHSDEQRSSLNCYSNGISSVCEVHFKERKIISDGASEYFDHMLLKDRLHMLISRGILKPTSVLQDNRTLSLPDKFIKQKIKSESLCFEEGESILSARQSISLVQVKNKPLESVDSCVKGSASACNFAKMVVLKAELESGDSYGDDGRFLSTLKHRKLESIFEFNASNDPETSYKHCTESKRSFSARNFFRPYKRAKQRKRKRDATGSVEIALDEDAPGLLQILVEHGVSADEMKLYGELEVYDPVDDSFVENSFSGLETVVSKLFLQRSSFLKFAPLRCRNEGNQSYCLACLFTLVEHVRHLQFRKWPAVWGWCRDLKSFIFVFERHNRLILERPEYGYATYFFELARSVSVEWQIRRLVAVMKFANCGRIALIEDKALSVEEDLTAEEAQVLMKFGWKPKSGLGSMLNYCDRVIHDRRNMIYASEWRSRISRLLMDGLDGGCLVSSKAFAECL